MNRNTLNRSAALRHLDIIVPIYKNAELLRACVDSLAQHIHEIADRQPRIILVNDSPGEDEVEALLDAYFATDLNLMVLRNEENIGFVGSVNRGLEISQRDEHDVLLVNSDTQTFPGTLSELLKSAHADPQIGFACPRSNNASICSLPHFFGGSLPTPEQSYQRWMEISRTMPPYHFSPTAVGFYMFIAHKVLANHGGLRRDFGVGYEEENDLVMRAGMLGTRAVIVNRAFAYHAGSASFSLKDLDLSTHKHGNLLKLTAYHPQFLPLVSRYENSPHYRAERILAGLLKDQDGRIKVAFDLSGMGQHYNGTNELAVGALRSMAKRQAHRIRLTGVGSKESFSSHELDKIPELYREEVGATTLHGIAIRLSQPFDLHQINTLESLAPINVFAMLDTISEDCGRLAIEGSFLEIWDHVAAHANGLVFISGFSEQTFCNRHRAALEVPRFARLLPTRASSYPKPPASSARDHILVVGNHFAHKGADVAGSVIAAAFPTINVIVLGSENIQSANLTIYRAGAIEPALIDRLFVDASVVVLPSHVEGFGLGFMHAISAGLPIVARRIPATDEILATLDEVTGVFLFDDNSGLVRACSLALNTPESRANYDRTSNWEDWADELTEFCLSVANRGDVFDRLVERIAAGDRLRRAARGDLAARDVELKATNLAMAPVLSTSKSLDLETLLELDGRTFVEHAYATVLCRPADQSGLDAYVKQLANGQHKLDVLEALAKSPEGRQRDVTLPNFDRMITRLHKARRPLLKRVFLP
jgi:GT2 family glycosyltransferase